MCLEAPVKYPVNIRLMGDGNRIASLSQAAEVASSGDYRPGFCFFEIEQVEKGTYTLIPSTFNPGIQYNLAIECRSPTNLC